MRGQGATGIPGQKKRLPPGSNSMAKRGKLIVFEGIDGSGKTTQSKLLVAYFKKQKIPTKYISFPRYELKWGKMVRKYLDGKLGKLDPYEASVLYANDRRSAAAKINGWLASGKTVIGNRYIGSNIGHMAAKIKSQSEKSKYIDWLERLEYGENKIPAEDLVILLRVTPRISRKLMRTRVLDIHEKDQKYLEEVSRVYDSVAKQKKNWEAVDCTESGKILKPEEIHKKVLVVLKKRNV